MAERGEPVRKLSQLEPNLARRKASMVRPDVIITDLRMPTMDGLQPDSFHRAAEHCAYAYLRKPVDAVKLKSVFGGALAGG